jgi:hypothetical protein
MCRRPTIMRIAVTIALTAALVACGRSPSPSTASGIFGAVTAGPTCPVEMQGSPCPPGLWTGEVTATDVSGRVFRTTTDDRGSYSLALAPGSYQVVPVTSGGPPFGKPTSVVVVAGAMQRVDLTVDTGIR